MIRKAILSIITLPMWLLLGRCSNEAPQLTNASSYPYLETSRNILDYRVTPTSTFDKSGLMFSDQGAWFAYSLPDSLNGLSGFSGPFLMTQQNGAWLSAYFTGMKLKVNGKDLHLTLKKQESYASHLRQTFDSDFIEVTQELTFLSGHTALIATEIENKTEESISLDIAWENSAVMADGISLSVNDAQLQLRSTVSNAVGHVLFPEGTHVQLKNGLHYKANKQLVIAANDLHKLCLSQSYIFPEYDWQEEKERVSKANFDTVLTQRKTEKNAVLARLIPKRKKPFQEAKYAAVLAKAQQTLQNNWRIPAGEIHHEGLFPSYHYQWFNGFWSWDSWKHAVGLAYYDTALAKEQVKLMFDFQQDNGFIVDCVFRDTTIENHNYRDTKPPLSAWAVAKIYEQDGDVDFVKQLYPKLKKYHEWWYLDRDHDQDGLCEYGCTDGTLVAAKWESGMDNAIRFDHAALVRNDDAAYSLTQESVDLNAYLYAEKCYLAQLASLIDNKQDVLRYKSESDVLKTQIQQQFYDEKDGWFYDTDLSGTKFIKGEGSEAWTALWAKAASREQAAAVKNRMMNPAKFYTKVPFQTMSADHPKFDPLKGYWRGPNWLDQSYFGIAGLRNYGFDDEANEATLQLLSGAEGLMGKGKAIRENYHPLTGEGLHAQNFSWSAAHIIMLLIEE